MGLCLAMYRLACSREGNGFSSTAMDNIVILDLKYEIWGLN